MTVMSRRGTLVALGGVVASGVSAGLVLVGKRPSTGPERGRGETTSFGSVALLRSRRRPAGAGPSGSAQPGHAQHAHLHQGTSPSEAGRDLAHGVWSESLDVDVEVRNGSNAPILVSPGQFRVRVGDSGTTVSLYSSDRVPGMVEAGSTTDMRISYLVPPRGTPLSLEFSEPGAVRGVRVGRLASRRARS